MFLEDVIFFDGFCGYTDKELDELKKKAKELGVKVHDRRKLLTRLFHKKEPGLTGIWFNVKTKKYETNNG